jgi:hypothetical protein
MALACDIDIGRIREEFSFFFAIIRMISARRQEAKTPKLMM